MLLSKTVMVKWNPANKKWFEEKGYIFTKWKDEFEVCVEDLSDGSHAEIIAKCDNINCEVNHEKIMEWREYKKLTRTDGKYFCHKCSINLYGVERMHQSKLKNSKSFEQWCYDNLDIDYANEILSRWNYELNGCKPSEVLYSSKGKNNKGYWFKCLQHSKHSSELKSITHFVSGEVSILKCKQCNSFGQWCIDNNKQDILDRWDYELNKKSPFEVSHASMGNNGQGYYFYCPNKIHESELKNIGSLTSGYYGSMNCIRCNSFGQYLINTYNKDAIDKYWAKENTEDVFRISVGSGKKVLINCVENKEHGYYEVACHSFSKRKGSRCPICNQSKGELKIREYLIDNKIEYIAQKEYVGLIGVGGGNLSYDFYLSKHNLLIEFQGKQHEEYSIGLHNCEKDFKIQQEHDRRKMEYAKNNNIELLEIWYYDYDNIEQILNEFQS